MDESVRQLMMGFVYQAVELTKVFRKKEPGIYLDLYDENISIEEGNLVDHYSTQFEDHYKEKNSLKHLPTLVDITKLYLDEKTKIFYNKMKEDENYINYTTKIVIDPFTSNPENFEDEEDILNIIKASLDKITSKAVKTYFKDKLDKINLDEINAKEQSFSLGNNDSRVNSPDEGDNGLTAPNDSTRTNLTKTEVPPNLAFSGDSGLGETASDMDLTEDSYKRKHDDIPHKEKNEPLIEQLGNTSTSAQETKRSKTVNEMDKASYYLTEGNANLPNTILAYYYLKMRDYVRVMRRMANYARVYRGDEDEIAMIEFKTTEDDKLVEKIHHTYSSNKQSSKDRYANIKKFLRADDIRVMKGVQKLEPEELADFSETDLYKKSNSNDNKWIYKHHSQ